jgi:hypothetical protein
VMAMSRQRGCKELVAPGLDNPSLGWTSLTQATYLSQTSDQCGPFDCGMAVWCRTFRSVRSF